MRRMTCLLGVLLVTGLSATALADGFGIAVGGSTLGIGMQAGVGLEDHFGVRAIASAYDYSTTRTESNIDYDATAKLKSFALLGDVHPFGGGFRLTAGLVFNRNRVDLTGIPTDGNFEFNGRLYAASQVGTLTGRAEWDRSLVPYVGIGYGQLGGNKGVKLIFDLGAVLTGSPNATLHAACGPAIVGTPACAQLQSDLHIEEKQLNNDIADYKWHPVLSFSLGVTF